MHLKLHTEKGEKFVADLVKLLHISILTYTTFGWLIKSNFVWISIIIMAPMLHIHWKTNNDKCILTNIENKLRKRDEDETFIGGLEKTILKIELSDSTVSKLAYSIMYCSALICILRLYVF